MATFSAAADFSSATFTADADFISATFSAYASFISATFTAAAYFRSATFTAAVDFRSATFSADASFSSATFSGAAIFSGATFEEKSQIFFVQTKFFGGLFFNYTNFKGYVAFEGKQGNLLFTGKGALLDLQNARIDDAKKLSFHTVRLQPSWFINTNSSEFVFTDFNWYYTDGRIVNIKKEVRDLKERGFENPNELLLKVCWQLADNHEESKMLWSASEFRKLANESKRNAIPWYLQPFTLRWWYWISSFYGESSSWATLVLVIPIFLIFPIIYTQTNFQTYPMEKPMAVSIREDAENEICKKEKMNCNYKEGGLSFIEAVAHSLTTATLQNVEYRKPLTVWGELWIILEKIFAPLQAALLALAIRRKFMR